MKRFISSISHMSDWIDLARNYLRRSKPPLKSFPPAEADVAYGPKRLQKLDFWHPTETVYEKSPVLIFFHGGGFVRGKKHHGRLLREAQALGVAAVSANYRLTRLPGTTVEDSMNDAVSVLEKVLEKAEDWNLDTSRIALAGNSAGGCMALWIAFTENPCAVKCVTTYNSLTSLDPDVLVGKIGGPRISHYRPLWALLFDAKGKDGLKDKRVRDIIERHSPNNFFHDGVPPVFLEFSEDPPPDSEDYPKGTSPLKLLHSPRYGYLLQELYQKLAQECVVSHPAKPAEETSLDFLKKHLLEMTN